MPAPDVFPGHASSRAARGLAGLLVAISRGSLPLLLVLVVVAHDPPIQLPELLQLLSVAVLLPALAVWLLRRATAARIELADTGLVIRRADLLVEVPYPALARVAPAIIPLPAAGLSVWLSSGRRLRYVIAVADPAPLLHALGPLAGDAARRALDHPTVRYAHAAAAMSPWRWYHYALKFVLFGLVPTAILFNAHQHIAYGGLLGEYYMFGAAAWTRTLLVYWLTLTIYLVLFASVWRAAAEAAALAAAWVAPSQATRVRRIAERSCQVLYYGGVPALLAARFLA